MIKLLNEIGGVIIDRVHDVGLAIWREAQKPTPGKPESIYEYTARRKAADDAKFAAVLATCECEACRANRTS